MKKILIAIMGGMSLCFTQLYAEQMLSDARNFRANLALEVGPSGPIIHNENFPKSYFLIPRNLPFMVGLTLHHPMRSQLKLTEKQVSEIRRIKQQNLPDVLGQAKQIRQMELELSDRFINGASAAKMEKSVEEIGRLRIELSKKHVHCIEQVKNILNGDQFKTLLSYANTH